MSGHSSLLPCLAAGFTVAATAVLAQDWPQWRGPERTGAVSNGVHLIEAVPESGLPVLWQSEPIHDTGNAGQNGNDVGYSSPVAAGGRVYLYLNQKVKDESPFRLTWGILNRLGCFESPLPAELAKNMEAARESPQRMALKDDAVPAWASDWVVCNLSHSQYLTLAAGIEDRLIRGVLALDLRTLNKLAALKDKPFARREDVEKALAEAGLGAERIASIVKELTGNRRRALDVIYCFDATTGKTLWKKEYPGALFEYGTSSTPCIAGGRIYVSGGKTIYCIETRDGSEIWQVPCPAKEVSSSPIVAEGILVLQAGSLCALDVKDGKLLWTRPEFKGIHGSPTIWRNDGKTYAVANCGMVDLQTGNLLWFIGNGGDSSPVVAGDLLVTARAGDIYGYRLATGKPQALWKQGYGIQPSTPIVFQNHLYGSQSQSGPLFCMELTTGKVDWTSPEKGYGASSFNTASSIIADGKVLLDNGRFFLVRASPAKFEQLGTCKIAAGNGRSSTPTVADGRLFIRGKESLVCYDLRRGMQ